MFEEAGEEKTPLKLLPKIGVDLCEKARQGKIFPPIGRDNEIDEALRILNKRVKNNPCLIGDPGVGKTAIVEGIACMIESGDCPDSLQGRRIFELRVMDILAEGASEIPKTVKKLLKELEDNPEIILFIDEVHMVMKHDDLANGFKPAMARGEMRLIGATTLNEFREHFEKDKALERRWGKVMIEEPSVEDAITILRGIKSKYEDFHAVVYEDDAIVACVKLSHRYVKNLYLPDKAIDLMDEIGAKIRTMRRKRVDPRVDELEAERSALQSEITALVKRQEFQQATVVRQRNEPRIQELNRELELLNSQVPTVEREVITKKMVEEFAAKKYKISAISSEGSEKIRAKELAGKMKVDVIGQDEAIDKISKVIKRNTVGLKNPRKPIGTFLLLGTTGVGKTFTIKTLAKHLTGDENNIKRFDMSEFAQPHTVSKFIGSPPGYVGFGQGGELTNAVKYRPNSIILFDEIEKADPKIFDVLLQVFDDGRLTDGEGKTVDFTNTIIFMTSNLGASAITTSSMPIGFGTARQEEAQEQKIKSSVMDAVYQHLRAEFINRIDEIIIFNPLTKVTAMPILDTQIKSVVKRLLDQDINITFSEELKNHVMEEGFDPKLGARPMERAVDRIIMTPLADYLIDNEGEKTIHIDFDPRTKKVIINGILMNERKSHIIRSFRLFS